MQPRFPMRRREFLALPALAAAAAASRGTQHVVLFTSDGVRWQELFNGVDPLLAKEDLRARFPKLMPFFWNTLVPQGILLRDIEVSNRYRVSYPGYSEILTGRAQDEVIKNNDPIRNPTPSFLQFLKKQSGLKREQVAVFASWKVIERIAQSQAGDLYINAGYTASELPRDSAKVALLNQLQFDARFPDSSSRHDAFTFELAMEYLERLQPQHMFISFDETDDWAHQKKYDQVLESLQYFDHALERLWALVQKSPEYRGRTTLVVTTDHGRGSTVDDWSGHGPKVPGDEKIWAAFIGPDTPHRGAISGHPRRYQRDIAPTILELLGADRGAYSGMTGSVIPEALS